MYNRNGPICEVDYIFICEKYTSPGTDLNFTFLTTLKSRKGHIRRGNPSEVRLTSLRVQPLFNNLLNKIFRIMNHT